MVSRDAFAFALAVGFVGAAEGAFLTWLGIPAWIMITSGLVFGGIALQSTIHRYIVAHTRRTQSLEQWRDPAFWTGQDCPATAAIARLYNDRDGLSGGEPVTAPPGPGPVSIRTDVGLITLPRDPGPAIVAAVQELTAAPERRNPPMPALAMRAEVVAVNHYALSFPCVCGRTATRSAPRAGALWTPPEGHTRIGNDGMRCHYLNKIVRVEVT